MQKKYSLKFSRAIIIKITVASIVFLLSFFVMPFNTEGDQKVYGMAYDGLSNLSLSEGYSFYSRSTSSQEFAHFFLSWVSSRFLHRDLFVALSNSILAYVAMSLFLKWGVSAIIASLFLLTNFYFLVLYFTAERLKFGFIFLIFSILYLGLNKLKRFCVFAALALSSHVSIIVFYVSILFNAVIKQTLRLLRAGKIYRPALFIAPALLLPLIFLKGHILDKFLYYYHGGNLIELWKVLIFLILAIYYSRKKGEAIMLFIPLIVAISLFGGDRLNMFGYFIFLYYGLQCRGGWNFGVLSTSLYFAYCSVDFLLNIFKYGNGFFLK